jgi:HD superfamily phosphohydrolase
MSKLEKLRSLLDTYPHAVYTYQDLGNCEIYDEAFRGNNLTFPSWAKVEDYPKSRMQYAMYRMEFMKNVHDAYRWYLDKPKIYERGAYYHWIKASLTELQNVVGEKEMNELLDWLPGYEDLVESIFIIHYLGNCDMEYTHFRIVLNEGEQFALVSIDVNDMRLENYEDLESTVDSKDESNRKNYAKRYEKARKKCEEDMEWVLNRIKVCENDVASK